MISLRWNFGNAAFTEVDFLENTAFIEVDPRFSTGFSAMFFEVPCIHPIYCPLLLHRRTFYASVLARRASPGTRFSKNEKRDEKKRTFRTKTEKSDPVLAGGANLSAMAYTRKAERLPET